MIDLLWIVVLILFIGLLLVHRVFLVLVYGAGVRKGHLQQLQFDEIVKIVEMWDRGDLPYRNYLESDEVSNASSKAMSDIQKKIQEEKP